jgi:undecaprenyl diphosphate synthase
MNKHNQSPGWRNGALVPRHVAIIMDGNGRWAESRGLPRSAGHHMGVEAVRRTVRAAMEIGIQYLTIFSFSSENWARPAAEIDDLMGLMRRFIRWDLAELHRNGVRIGVIGERDRVDPELLALIDEAFALTSENSALNLMIAFNYGSRAEIARAARRLAERALEGAITPQDITPEALSAALDTNGVPDPDLLIRTSGELRLSNFLLWQSAYTEFVFLDAYWPDFGRDLLQQAIEEFRGRIRRFGGVVTPVDPGDGRAQRREANRMSEHDEAGGGDGAHPELRARLGADFAQRLVSGLAMGAEWRRCARSGYECRSPCWWSLSRMLLSWEWGRLVHGREGDVAIAVHAAAAGGSRGAGRHSRKSASGCCCCRSGPFWRRC